MKPYRAAVIQLNAGSDPAEGVSQAEELATRAISEGAQFLVLPECAVFLAPESELVPRIAEVAAAGRDLLERLARTHHVAVAGGVYSVEEDPDRIFNTCLVFDATGREAACYHKLHLFDVHLPDGASYEESRYIASGDTAVQYDSEDFGQPGLSICYDLRFPELYRKLSQEGSRVLLVPSAFTEFTGRDHWQALLRARAIENTCYVIAPAQCGVHFGKRESHGHSMIVDPWGNIVAELGQEPGFAIATIDPEVLKDVRARLPSLNHRKL